MKRVWFLFSQAVTMALAIYFVLLTLKPQWVTVVGDSRVAERLPGETSATPVGSFRTAAARAASAVVSINTSKSSDGPKNPNPWFRFFYGDQDEQSQLGLGSGVVVSAQGYILTNNHVIEGADEIEVTLNDQRKARAKVVGTDPDTDLAVLKIGIDNLPAITFGASDSLQVGDWVLAIGNPFGVGQTVTSGIVSALGRNQLRINTFEDFIQTDAAINPGNSGGALVDTEGRLLGINTAIYSQSGGSLGIGFAIPMSTAKHVLDSIVRDGRVTRGWIGVEPRDISPEIAQTFGIKNSKPDAGPPHGVIITGVLQGGPASGAGIQPGDIITGVGGKMVDNVAQLLSTVAALEPGKPARVIVLRRAERLDLVVTPGVRPKPKPGSR